MFTIVAVLLLILLCAALLFSSVLLESYSPRQLRSMGVSVGYKSDRRVLPKPRSRSRTVRSMRSASEASEATLHPAA